MDMHMAYGKMERRTNRRGVPYFELKHEAAEGAIDVGEATRKLTPAIQARIAAAVETRREFAMRSKKAAAIA